MTRAAWAAVLVACAGPGTPPAEVVVEPLSTAQRTVRASMLVRGLRPSADELAAVAASPDALDHLVDDWLETEAFLTTVRDLHAEALLVRTDTEEQLPSYGPLDPYSTWRVHQSTTEEPLRLISWVIEHDRPYTEIFTADYAVVDEIVARAYGLDHDPAGPEWQPTPWVDGRPNAGILVSSELWRRHLSAGSNFHRARAEFLARTFLCSSFAERDLTIAGGVDLADEFAVAHAVSENTNCVGCHQALDPLAAYFWGFRHQLQARAVRLSYDDDCTYNPDNVVVGAGPMGGLPEDSWTIRDSCYPLRFYIPTLEDDWQEWDLRPPSFYGLPGDRLDDLGALIAADPRMPACTVRRFWGWFAQQPGEDLDEATHLALTEQFVATGYDAKALVKAIVTHPRFQVAATSSEDPAEQPVGLLQIRPEQLDSVVADLTGFTWWGDTPATGCVPNCWGAVNLMRSDLYGFRTMSGGIDGIEVTAPHHAPAPTHPMVLARFASEAAAHVVRSDFALPPDQRRLLGGVEPDTADEAAIRAQLDELQLRVFGHVDPALTDRLAALRVEALAATGDPERAWILVLSAMLQDPAMVFY